MSTILKSYTTVSQGFAVVADLFQLAEPVRLIIILLNQTLPQHSFLLKMEFYLLFPYMTDNPIPPSTHPMWVNTAPVFHIWVLAYAAYQKLLFLQGLNK